MGVDAPGRPKTHHVGNMMSFGAVFGAAGGEGRRRRPPAAANRAPPNGRCPPPQSAKICKNPWKPSKSPEISGSLQDKLFSCCYGEFLPPHPPDILKWGPPRICRSKVASLALVSRIPRIPENPLHRRSGCAPDFHVFGKRGLRRKYF